MLQLNILALNEHKTEIRTLVTQKSLAALGFAVLLSTAACSTKAPVAAGHPVSTAPVAPAQMPPSQPGQRASNPTYTPPPSQPRSQEMPPIVRKAFNQVLVKLEDALYDYDQSTIRADASAALKDDVAVIRYILASYPRQKLVIEGNCDERGSEEYNLALGERRARAAQEFLASMGIPDAQLTIVSFGKDHPVCTEHDEACWQRNRRVHVTAAP